MSIMSRQSWKTSTKQSCGFRLNAFLSHMKEGPCLANELGSLRAQHFSGDWLQQGAALQLVECTQSQQGELDHVLGPIPGRVWGEKWWGVVLE